MSSYPRVRFHVRFPAGDYRWRYEPVSIRNPEGAGFVPLEYPPAAGDLISLWDEGDEELRGTFRVLERMWAHSERGSADWPYGEREPRSGPLLEIVVEPADGPCRDEAPLCGYQDCRARLLFGEWVPRPGYGDPEPHVHLVPPDPGP